VSYYERLGSVEEPPRNGLGYRISLREALERVRFANAGGDGSAQNKIAALAMITLAMITLT
jgi:DNA-binding transcriptional MerR regulator